MNKATRAAVYAAIDSEREYQIKCHTPDDNHSIGDFISFMDTYFTRVKEAHALPMSSTPEGKTKTLDVIRKVAGLAVACMEIHGAPLRK